MTAISVAFRGTLGTFDLDAAFEAPARGITALFGPSGCGKTSVLRCIAGLQRLPGFCSVAGETWQDRDGVFLPTHRRAVGYVFQEASLFPHLSVRRNLNFGAGRGAASRADSIPFDEVVDLLGLERLLDRSPRNLSGGERQRVAVGRALLSQPSLLLMDEPLSALDAATKSEILPFLERLHDRLSLPAIYITHDMAEVERLADHLVLMESGRVIASGSLAEMQADPSLPLATARDAAVTLDAVVESFDAHYGLLTLAVAGGHFQAPASGGAIGEHRRLRIVAGDVSLAREAPGPSSILNIMPAQVHSISAIDHNATLVVLGLGADGSGARLLARLTRKSAEALEIEPGMTVHAQVKGVALAPSSAGISRLG
jgi:molybdate transport system ATP-binding protein